MTNQVQLTPLEIYHSKQSLPVALPAGERLGLVFYSAQDIPEVLFSGLPLEGLTRLGEQLALSQAETLKLVDLSEASSRRRRMQGRFTPEKSERLYRFADLLQAA